jgi:hypothetical protein
MDAIVIRATIGEDKRLVLDLPPETPVGPVDVVITPHTEPTHPVTNPAREAARAKLLAAGKLVTDIHAPEGTVPLSPEELVRIGTLPPGSPSLEDLINADRGEY